MSTTTLPLDLSRVPPVDAVGVEERAAALAKRSIKKDAKRAGIRLALSMIDLTTLEGKDSEGKVWQMCQKALHPAPEDPSVPPVAAVCVYPNLVLIAQQALVGSTVKVASLSTGFPSGQYALPLKVAETRKAVGLGAEGPGLQPEAMEACSVTSRIPISSAVDSLNVAAAAAIAMWELSR